MLRGIAGLLHFQLKEHGTSASATLLGSVNSSGEDSGIDIAAAAASAQSRSHALPFPGHSFACPLLCFAWQFDKGALQITPGKDFNAGGK